MGWQQQACERLESRWEIGSNGSGLARGGRIPTLQTTEDEIMAKTNLPQPVLSEEQQAEAEQIFERIQGAFLDEARRLAGLMASKPTEQIFGETEYEVRDGVHALGARVLEAAAEERVKKRRLSRC
jgi:hypothetical protein